MLDFVLFDEVKENFDDYVEYIQLICLRNLSRLDARPAAVQGRIFEKLFKAAEIKQLTTKEMETYNKSILEYDDIRSAVDYAREEGREAGIKTIAINCLKQGMAVEEISRITGLKEKEIRELENRKSEV